MRKLALILLIPVLASCAGSDGPEPVALVQRALEATGGAEAHAGIERLGIEFEGRLVPPEGQGGPTAFAGEWLLDGTGGLATRQSTGGQITRKALLPEGGWFRRGAAVGDLAPWALRAERADRDDLLALLVAPLLARPFRLEPAGKHAIRVTREGGEPFLFAFDPGTGLPARIERVSIGESGGKAPLVRTFADWTDHDGLLFPRRIVTELAGGRQELEVKSLVRNPPATGTAFVRPDDSGPGSAGEIRRETFPATSVVAVAQQGPYTDLASVDLFLSRAIDHAKATKKGPRIRIFQRFGDGDVPPLVVTMVPVEFARESAAQGLPRQMRVEFLPETEALVMPYTGPYPENDEVYAPLHERAGELGLAPVGRPWHAILSDPDAGPPNELRQEIRLPVKEAD